MTASEIQRLAEMASTGDETAFDRLYSTFFTPLYRYILAQVRHKETAEDIVQNTFVKVLAALKKGSPLPGSFQAYTYAMARNAVIDHQRKKKDILPSDSPLEESFQEVAAVDSSGMDFDAKADQASLFRLLATAEPIEREIISLHYLAELPHRTIAETLNRSEASVRQIQSRALKKLRQIAPQFFS